MSEYKHKGIIVVMPAFEPSAGLPARVHCLCEVLRCPVVVVDDGSSPSCRPFFDAVAGMPGCTILRHDVNRGKGSALKTAFAFIAERFPECSGVITVDSDGQHSPEDCLRLAEELAAGSRALYLGVRDLSFRATPFRSWWGNRCTTLLFALLFWRWVPDTQTGLRAFRRQDIPFFLSVPGTGYEYEMAVLARAARTGMPFKMTPIRTIYEAGNSSSHFHPLRDTIRIHRALFSSFWGNVFFCRNRLHPVV